VTLVEGKGGTGGESGHENEVEKVALTEKKESVSRDK